MVYSAKSDDANTISQFTRRKAIKITTGGTSTPANYQVKVTIDYEPEMQSLFQDIRFNTKAGVYIDYWIESYVASTSAVVWLELPDAITDPGSDTIWMYYGAGLSDGGDIHAMSAGLGDDFTGVSTTVGGSFTKYASNPVLNLGAAGKFDDTDIHEPCVWKEGATYYMFYGGNEGASKWETGYATSNDGINWTRQNGGDPVFLVGAAGKFDDEKAYGPHIIKENSTYYMWYQGYDGAEYAIGLATSTDLVNWTRQNNGDAVFSKSVAGWDNDGVWAPYIFKEGSTYYMFYNNAATTGIGYATSTDKITWTRGNGGNAVKTLGAGGAWDDFLVLEPCIIKMGSTYYMFYEGHDGANSRIGYSTSSDLITWSTGIQIMNLGAAGTWDDVHHSAFHVLLDTDFLTPLVEDGNYKAWFSGEDPIARIGYATRTLFGLDDTKWTSSGASISTGILNINAADEYIRSINTFQYGYAVKTKMRINTYASYGTFGFKTGVDTTSTDQASFWIYVTPTVKVITDNSVAGSEYIVDMGNLGTDWRTYEMIRYAAAAKVEYFVDDGDTSTGSTTDANAIPTVTLPVQLAAITGAASIDLDWMFVRKYITNEPTASYGTAQHQRRVPQYM